jgi:GT2 family glycosyltransferase
LTHVSEVRAQHRAADDAVAACITVITLLWRNERFAPAFLDSLDAAARRAATPVQLIAVENGPDGRLATEALSSHAVHASHVVLAFRHSSTNVGFAGGANLGCAAATGDVLVVANLDLEFDPDFVVRLREQQTTLATPCFLAPSVASPARSGHDGDVDRGPLRRDRLHRPQAVDGALSPGQRVPAASGSCLIFGRALYARRSAAVGGLFDEEFHSYYEDVDLFWWAEQRAIPTRWAPAIKVVHHQGGSFDGKYRFRDRSPELRASVMANYRLTVWRRAAGPLDVLCWLAGECGYLAKCTVYSGPSGVATYARSWPLALGRLRTINARRGSWR